VFFAIWWAWVNFTWFASAYDSDDVPYRLLVLCQMTGALIVAGGVPAMFEARAANWAVVGGYVVMRLAALTQWLRVAAADERRRSTAHRYATGIALMQMAWIGLMFMPSFTRPGFVVLAVLEMLVPAWAERAEPTTWHPHHIAERYGLFTLIVLGESILAATVAVESGLRSGETFVTLLPIIAGGLLIVFSMWWMYFDRPVHDLLTNLQTALVWGYGHYFVFGAAAGVGAGLAAAVDAATHHATISSTVAGAAVAVPVAIFILSLWVIHHRPAYQRTRFFGPVAAALVLVTPLTGAAVPLIGIILATLVGLKLAVSRDSSTGLEHA
jgi:low temperature requirement protein LtrA